MSSDFLTAKGTLVPPADLRAKRARQTAVYLLSGLNPFVSFVEARRGDSAPFPETVVFDVRVDRPARVKNDIRYQERIAVIFDPEDRCPPEVLAMREDFPRLPHTNLRDFETPKSLCLYDRNFEELRSTWTPESFVQRIEQWLAKSAVGTLHAQDQMLEPFLGLDAPKILLPMSFYEQAAGEQRYFSIFQRSAGEKNTYVVEEISESTAANEKEVPPMVGFTLVTPPVVHGVINFTPTDFGGLCRLFTPVSFDLLNSLRNVLRERFQTLRSKSALFKARLVLFITIPHKREESGGVESTQTWAFAFIKDIGELGSALGVWSTPPGSSVYGLNLTSDPSKPAADQKILPLVPIAQLTPSQASLMNGVEDSTDVKGLFVGAGALGSYTLVNLVRAGFGKWTVIDSDILLPHNSARHFLPSTRAGYSKSELVAFEGNRIFPTHPRISAIHDDIIHPAHPEVVAKALAEASIVVDCTTSVSAARALERAYEAATARRISIFLSPNGADLVSLAESRDRSLRLDALEMQYLRAVCEIPSLHGHLNMPHERIRYARTCADVSSTISNDLVVLHSAIASSHVRKVDQEAHASIEVWRCNVKDFSVTKVSIPLSKPVTVEAKGWRVISDEGLIAQLRAKRSEKLPSETGGSLIGTFDLTTKTIYVVASLPTPTDSVEERTKFIRGESGNLAALQSVIEKTADQLKYIGEWHSHPRGASTIPSQDDLGLFAALEGRMLPAGLPAAMLIIGESTLSLTITPPESAE